MANTVAWCCPDPWHPNSALSAHCTAVDLPAKQIFGYMKQNSERPVVPPDSMDSRSEEETGILATGAAVQYSSQKKPAEVLLEKYLLYDKVLQVYTLIYRGKAPVGVHFADIITKRRAYKMVFDVLYRTLHALHTVRIMYACILVCVSHRSFHH